MAASLFMADSLESARYYHFSSEIWRDDKWTLCINSAWSGYPAALRSIRRDPAQPIGQFRIRSESLVETCDRVAAVSPALPARDVEPIELTDQVAEDQGKVAVAIFADIATTLMV
jgi:hypothetical protein